MRVQPDKLSHALDREDVRPVYLVCGDEPLQLGESADLIRTVARDTGHTTREVFEAGTGFDWQILAAEAASVSLFADKKLIDLRVPNGKPGREGGQAIAAYCAAPPPDTLLLLTMPRIDRQQQSSKWFKAVDQAGVVVQVWPIDPQRLPAWITQRLKGVGITPSDEAVKLLADRVEGNLLAARQEIDKLALLHGGGALDMTQMRQAVSDSARYDPFELVDSALRGETARCVHILAGLRGEGVAPARVLWALHREVRQNSQIAADVARGLSIDHALSRTRVLSRRSGLVRRAVGRFRAAQWLALLDQCRYVDRSIKGLDAAQPWLLLEDLVVRICGQTALAGQAHGRYR